MGVQVQMGSEFSSLTATRPSSAPSNLKACDRAAPIQQNFLAPLNGHDCVYAAEERPKLDFGFKPSMPVLEPPSNFSKAAPHKPPMGYNDMILAIISSLEDIHKVGGSIQLTQNKEFTTTQQKISELQEKELVELKEKAERAAQSGFWSFLQTIGSYILSAINVVLGLFLASQGSAIIGGVMIAAGLIEVANLAFSTCGIWSWLADYLAGENEELAQQLATILPGAVGLTAAALGVIGGIELFSMYHELDLAEQILVISKTAVTFGEGVATIGKGVANYKITQSESRKLLLEGQLEESGHLSEKLTESMGKMTEMLADCTSHVAKIIRMTNYASKLSLQIQG